MNKRMICIVGISFLLIFGRTTTVIANAAEPTIDNAKNETVNQDNTESSANSAENKKKVAISVEAADDNGNVTYAIDSTDAEAFGNSNTFYVDPGSNHTVYVKDVAGNISSQDYYVTSSGETIVKDDESSEKKDEPAVKAEVVDSFDKSKNDRTVNIDVDLTNDTSNSHNVNAAEEGGGTVYERVNTDGSEDAEKVFYTVTTKEGEAFYIVIDKNKKENNVYLLDQVSVNDLQDIAKANEYNFSLKAHAADYSGNLLSQLQDGSDEDIDDITTAGNSNKSARKNLYATSGKDSLLIIILAAIGGAAFYYFKVLRNRKDAQMDEIDDAMDMDEFETDDGTNDDEEDEETDFFAYKDDADSDEEIIEINQNEEEYLNQDPNELNDDYVDLSDDEEDEDEQVD